MSRHFVYAIFLLSASLVLQASAEVDDNELPYGLVCDGSKWCFMDLTPHCLVGGRAVYGHCELKAAICDEGEQYDQSVDCLDDVMNTID